MAVNFEGVEYLTFDCYGTLIDWETGIVGSLRPIIERHDRSIDERTLLERFATFEAEIEAGEFVPYREVLRRVVDCYGQWLGFEPSQQDRESFSSSVGAWPAFPDTKEALAQLATRFRLVVLSNVDDDLFSGSDERLGSPFHAVFTAQQIGSYKPSKRNFRYAIEKLGGEASRIVHVAQSLYHDIAPAREVGLRTVWIDRRSGQKGTGATPLANADPDAKFESLAAIADALT